MNAGIQNAGQTCSASSRILVHESRYNEVLSRMAERYAALRAGPAVEDLELGPLVSQRQKTIVDGFLAKGADLDRVGEGVIAAQAPANVLILPRSCLLYTSPSPRD